MTEPPRDFRRQEIALLGLRAQATAAALVQLCIELRAAGVLQEEAVGRIKETIAQELAGNAPRSTTKQQFLTDVRARLDKIFAGQQPVGAVPLADVPGATSDDH